MMRHSKASTTDVYMQSLEAEGANGDQLDPRRANGY
jgi:hypothetical protein